MFDQKTYDVAIIGGGLAGLALSIQLANEGHSVVLFEKERYPYHKVCGEYISMESWDFLLRLGMPLQAMNLPVITKLQLTSPSGTSFKTHLPLGGFGISRYVLDLHLSILAKQLGVTVLEETKVEEVQEGNGFNIKAVNATNTFISNARVCCGAWGKRSNLDVKWKRDFIVNKEQQNYVGVKYHVQTDWPADTIGLHNFNGGYCGISKIEADRYCLCYLTTAKHLKNTGSIDALNETVLYKNPVLKQIFQNSRVLPTFPVTIAQISFAKKTTVDNNVLLLGDAASMITPLCGNGMSMALHSSKIAAPLIHNYLQGMYDYGHLKKLYMQQWQKRFGNRLKAGRVIQKFFGGPAASTAFVMLLKTVPFIAPSLIKKTHGQPF